MSQIKYLPFLTLQTLVDSAFMWSRSGDLSVLPVTEDELCQARMVRDRGSGYHHSTDIPLQIYADKPMTYSLKGSLQNLDIFQLIQLFLTPICTIFSFAFTVPLVLKVWILLLLSSQ